MQISTTKEPLNDRSISPHFRDSKKIKKLQYTCIMWSAVNSAVCLNLQQLNLN